MKAPKNQEEQGTTAPPRLEPHPESVHPKDGESESGHKGTDTSYAAAIYPASLRLRGRQCTVIGGGHVAVRKVESLLAAGAKVRVISPAAKETLLELARAGTIEYEARPYRLGDASDGFLVVAATNQRNVNRQIAAEADEHERFVNVVDDPELCSFHVPASCTKGSLTVSISTHGLDPRAAKRFKQILVYDLEHGTGAFPSAVRGWLGGSSEGNITST